MNTDSGRLGIVLPAVPPAQTPPAFPPVATYTAGSGTQIGLLSSPTAVAVTNPGTILVLEPGALQVSAFDLNGNPVRYFVTGPGGVAGTQFTLSLVNKGSYLDLAVDGSNQLYLLYYTGDGSAPADYCVDVYSPLGVLVAGGISGVNVPHFAVDYWRNIFAANYDALADTVTGQAHIDPALGVAEPSLSVFSPDNSATATRLGRRRRAAAPPPQGLSGRAPTRSRRTAPGARPGAARARRRRRTRAAGREGGVWGGGSWRGGVSGDGGCGGGGLRARPRRGRWRGARRA